MRYHIPTPRRGCRAWRAGLALPLLLVAATMARAQQAPSRGALPDSVREAIARYRAAVAASDSCRHYPELLADTGGPLAGFQRRRDPATGRECTTGLKGLLPPTAFVIDGQLVCPSLHPSEWGGELRGVEPGEVLRLEVSRDSSVLARVRCTVPPFGLVWITTNRQPPDSAR